MATGRSAQTNEVNWQRIQMNGKLLNAILSFSFGRMHQKPPTQLNN